MYFRIIEKYLFPEELNNLKINGKEEYNLNRNKYIRYAEIRVGVLMFNFQNFPNRYLALENAERMPLKWETKVKLITFDICLL